MGQDKFKAEMDNKVNYDFFGNDNMETLHWGKLFVHLFRKYFSIYRINYPLSAAEIVEKLIKEYKVEPENVIRTDVASKDKFTEIDDSHFEVFLILKEGFCVAIASELAHIMYCSDITEKEKTDLIKTIEKHKIKEKKHIRKFYMLQQNYGSLALGEFEISTFEMNIKTHYNDDFETTHKKIETALRKKDQHGLILLHGKIGAGKTSYLRHLISTINREFIYLPLEMMSAINSPELLPFIARHKNAVIILEDCESLLTSRDSNPDSVSALSNLLNLGDGLLSDALSINIICTFNSGLRKIDDAILRKGRLIARYEFKELSLEKTRKLFVKLGNTTFIPDKAMTLAEIYNHEADDYQVKAPTRIGFKK